MDIKKSIGINTYTTMYNLKVKKTENKQTEVAEENLTKNVNSENKQISANDVLTFMANQSACMKPEFHKTINVTKFVNKEQYDRIGNMMREFEASVENGLRTLEGEFPNKRISQNAKLTIVLNSLERTV